MKYRLNLLLPKEKSFVDKAVYFALNYLRYILVITQIVVIGVFFYRFKIDQEIIDLKEELDQKQEIITVSDPLIKEAQVIDKKLGVVNQTLGKQLVFSQSFDYVMYRIPLQFRLKTFRFGENGSISIAGSAMNTAIIRAFYQRMQKESAFSSVVLEYIAKEPGGFAFSFSFRNYIAKR